MLGSRRTIRKRKRPAFAGLLLKRMKGLEPSTFCMASRRSSQLSYIRGRPSIDRPCARGEGCGARVARKQSAAPGSRRGPRSRQGTALLCSAADWRRARRGPVAPRHVRALMSARGAARTVRARRAGGRARSVARVRRARAAARGGRGVGGRRASRAAALSGRSARRLCDSGAADCSRGGENRQHGQFASHWCASFAFH